MALDGYVRVSRRAGREGESFISPDLQRDKIEGWAKLRGVEIAAWHEDIDVSGGKLERPGLDALMARIESGETGGVAVARLDRLSRAGVADALKLVERIHDHGGQVAAIDLGVDPNTPFGEFGMTLMLALARMERRRIKDSWDTAQERAVSRGVHISSRCPTGYVRREDGRLELHPTDGPVVGELFRMRADGASWAALCDHLNENGVEGPYSATFWTPRAVQHMIANKVYLGQARSGRHTNADAHEPLIDRGTWEAAQRARGVSSPRNGDGALLAGLLRCAGCRHVLKPDSIRDRNGEKLRTYRCRGKHSTGRCEDRSAVLERVVLPVIEDAMFRVLGATRVKELNESENLRELELAVQAADAELVAYRDDERIEGALGADRFVEGLQKRAALADEANRRLAEARAVIAPDEDSTDIEEAWPEMPVAMQKALLARVFDAVVLRSGRNRPIEDRIWLLLRGTMPDDMPRRGKRYPLKPFEFESLSVEEGTDLVRRTRKAAHEGVLR